MSCELCLSAVSAEDCASLCEVYRNDLGGEGLEGIKAPLEIQIDASTTTAVGGSGKDLSLATSSHNNQDWVNNGGCLNLVLRLQEVRTEREAAQRIEEGDEAPAAHCDHRRVCVGCLPAYIRQSVLLTGKVHQLVQPNIPATAVGADHLSKKEEEKGDDEVKEPDVDGSKTGIDAVVAHFSLDVACPSCGERQTSQWLIVAKPSAVVNDQGPTTSAPGQSNEEGRPSSVVTPASPLPSKVILLQRIATSLGSKWGCRLAFGGSLGEQRADVLFGLTWSEALAVKVSGCGSGGGKGGGEHGEEPGANGGANAVEVKKGGKKSAHGAKKGGRAGTPSTANGGGSGQGVNDDSPVAAVAAAAPPVQLPPPPPCGICEEAEGAVECKECQFALCDGCHRSVHSRGKFKQHTVVPLGTLQASLPVPCSFHPSYSEELYCEECQVAMCLVCSFQGHHKGHPAKPLQDVLHELTDGLKTELHRVDSDTVFMHRLESELNRSRDDVRLQGEQISARIREAFARLVVALQRREGELLESLGRVVQEKASCIDRNLLAVGALVQSLDTAKQLCQGYVQEGQGTATKRSAEFLSIAPKLRRRLELALRHYLIEEAEGVRELCQTTAAGAPHKAEATEALDAEAGETAIRAWAAQYCPTLADTEFRLHHGIAGVAGPRDSTGSETEVADDAFAKLISTAGEISVGGIPFDPATAAANQLRRIPGGDEEAHYGTEPVWNPHTAGGLASHHHHHPQGLPGDYLLQPTAFGLSQNDVARGYYHRGLEVGGELLDDEDAHGRMLKVEAAEVQHVVRAPKGVTERSQPVVEQVLPQPKKVQQQTQNQHQQQQQPQQRPSGERLFSGLQIDFASTLANLRIGTQQQHVPLSVPNLHAQPLGGLQQRSSGRGSAPVIGGAEISSRAQAVPVGQVTPRLSREQPGNSALPPQPSAPATAKGSVVNPTTIASGSGGAGLLLQMPQWTAAGGPGRKGDASEVPLPIQSATAVQGQSSEKVGGKRGRAGQPIPPSGEHPQQQPQGHSATGKQSSAINTSPNSASGGKLRLRI